MARPKLSQSELRTKIINVRFSYEEYENLLEVMDRTGHDSPSTFLRASGLRSNLPAKIIVAETDKNLLESLEAVLADLSEVSRFSTPDVIEMAPLLDDVSKILGFMRKTRDWQIQTLQEKQALVKLKQEELARERQ